MDIEIKELYKIPEDRYEEVYELFLEAFAEYPKLARVFEDPDRRQIAIEMVLRFYCPYDFCYGSAYSLDENIHEAVVLVHSDEMTYDEERMQAAGCYNEAFEKAKDRLTPEEQKRWWAFFDELDRQEQQLDIPRPHIYADFLAVRNDMQGQGNGSRLLQAVCRYADEQKLPIMLFTNGRKDVEFYLKNGFRIIGVTRSEELGLENTYVIYDENR
ncbi:MAG: GNAT family N-acetyltransferase [Bacillota bacterium]|nr:GNAT family N-acetyltransferase [Bacillota bacterium]